MFRIRYRTKTLTLSSFFVDFEGNILGTHKGIIRYTIGQRKGLGIALGKPQFVLLKNPVTNEVTLGDEEHLFKTRVYINNVNLQAALNPPSRGKNERKSRDIVFREGDRVMQTKNNYSIEWEKEDSRGMGIFNGDIGTIEDIDTAAGEMLINFDGRYAVYDTSELDELELSYAITVHKSQGSEYPVVVIPVYGCAPMLLNRCLLYTAITRAAKLCVIVARNDCLERMVKGEAHHTRCTGLMRHTRKYFGTYE